MPLTIIIRQGRPALTATFKGGGELHPGPKSTTHLKTLGETNIILKERHPGNNNGYHLSLPGMIH